MAAEGCTRIVRTTTFARAARRYWLGVFPYARAELAAWRRRAELIPDPTLRNAALDALRTKSNDLEGAVAFAAFAPSRAQTSIVRAITAFQLAFDYLDTVAELPNVNPIRNGHCLNQALLVAFSPGTPHPDYYQHQPRNDDAGYLKSLIDTCRAAICTLPSFAAVMAPARRALLRVVTYQSLTHGDANGSHAAFTDWAHSQSVPGIDMQWWETGAATGSQLSVLALIAAAADPRMQADRATAIEHAYFPWIGALGTLLDSIIDRRLDRIEGQRSLVDYYTSPLEMSERLRIMAIEARRAIHPLVDAENHILILAAMAAFFHSAPQASAPDVALATRAVLDAMGNWSTLQLIFFRTRRALARNSPPYMEQSYTTAIPSSPKTGNPDTSFTGSSGFRPRRRISSEYALGISKSADDTT
jgi:tetraprenyl-beta-curcumene synthase